MNVRLVPVDKCPLCKSSKFKFIFTTYDVQFSKTLMEFNLVKCKQCGLVYMKERPSEESVGQFYPEESYPTYQGSLEIKKSFFQNTIKPHIKTRLKERGNHVYDKLLLKIVPVHWRVAAMFPSHSKVLDIGCGAGWRLDLYKEFEWDTYGFDISTAAIEIATAKGHKVFQGRINDTHYPENYFDAVQIYHVIEHLSDPVYTLERVSGILKRDGVLLISTPNQSSLTARICGRDFWQIDSPRHFQLFNADNLRLVLNNAGFNIQELLTMGLRGSVTNSVQAFVTRKYGKEKSVKSNFALRSIDMILFYFFSVLNKLGLGEDMAVLAKKKNGSSEIH